MQEPNSRLVRMVVIMAAILTVGGCNLTSEPKSPDSIAQRPLISAQAKIDPNSGQISLPLDRLLPTDEQWREIDYARDILVARCAAESGVTFDYVDRRGEPPQPSRRYGVWTEEYARAYGHGVAPDPPTAKEAEALNRRAVSESDSRVIEACRATPELQRLALGNITEPQIAASDIYERTLGSSEGQRVLTLWRECIQRAGHSPIARDEGSPFVLGEAAGDGTSAGAPLALVDVRCKRTVRLVETLAAVEAREQWQFVEQHRGRCQAV